MPRLPVPSRILSLFRHPLRVLRRKAPPVAESGSAPLVSFRCNICGIDCRVPATAISRETPSCAHCGSTVRGRAIVHVLTSELFGRSVALPDLLERRDMVGIGLSDAECYAGLFSRMRVTDEAVPEYGIEWPQPWSVPMVARQRHRSPAYAA